MALAWEDLREYVGAHFDKERSLQRSLDVATALVDSYVGTAAIPVAIRDQAVLETAAELYDRAMSSPDAGQVSPDGGVQLRVSRDPLRPAYGLLKRWVVPF